jgi:hypothetical protein
MMCVPFESFIGFPVHHSSSVTLFPLVLVFFYSSVIKSSSSSSLRLSPWITSTSLSPAFSLNVSSANFYKNVSLVLVMVSSHVCWPVVFLWTIVWPVFGSVVSYSNSSRNLLKDSLNSFCVSKVHSSVVECSFSVDICQHPFQVTLTECFMWVDKHIFLRRATRHTDRPCVEYMITHHSLVPRGARDVVQITCAF